MYVVRVEGLEFYAHHGVPAEERKIGHRYRLDLTLQVAGTADLTDDVRDTVDYAEVANYCLELAQSDRFKTIERVARIVASGLVERFPAVESARVKLSKLLPPAPVVAEATSVEILAER